MIVTKTDNIPHKKIVSVLGKVSIKMITDETKIRGQQKLIRKAKTLGADAIINFSIRYRGLFAYICTYSGIAVKTEDIIPVQQAMNLDVCWKCGKQINKIQRYCGSCGAKQVLLKKDR